jgi:multisubunit Na+/H+ antiporter MnhF subunit
MNSFLETCIIIASGLLGLAFLCTAWRFLRGPSVLDRILAFDMCAVVSVGLLVLVSLHLQTGHYLELLLVYSLLGFSTTTAFTVYLTRSERAEQEVAGHEPTDTDER